MCALYLKRESDLQRPGVAGPLFPLPLFRGYQCKTLMEVLGLCFVCLAIVPLQDEA